MRERERERERRILCLRGGKVFGRGVEGGGGGDMGMMGRGGGVGVKKVVF